MSAYSLEALLKAPKDLLSSIIQLRREYNQHKINQYSQSYCYLSNVCNGYIETLPFQVYYKRLKQILDDAGIDQNKLGNNDVYVVLKKLESEINDFVKDIRYPYKSY